MELFNSLKSRLETYDKLVALVNTLITSYNLSERERAMKLKTLGRDMNLGKKIKLLIVSLVIGADLLCLVGLTLLTYNMLCNLVTNYKL